MFALLPSAYAVWSAGKIPSLGGAKPLTEADLVQGRDGLHLCFLGRNMNAMSRPCWVRARAAMQRSIPLAELSKANWIRMLRCYSPNTHHLPIHELEPPLPDGVDG